MRSSGYGFLLFEVPFYRNAGVILNYPTMSLFNSQQMDISVIKSANEQDLSTIIRLEANFTQIAE